MVVAFYKPIEKSIVFGKIKPEHSIILCYKDKSMARTHWSMLRQFRLSNGSYMLSEDLLMVVARIFNVEFEDLWNKVYMNDQIDLITSRCSPTRTNDWMDDIMIDIDV